MARERRRWTRWAWRRNVAIMRGDSRQMSGLVEDISRGGIRLHGNFRPPLRVGEELRVTLPTSTPALTARAEVRWVSPTDPGLVGLQLGTVLRSQPTDGEGERPRTRRKWWRRALGSIFPATYWEPPS